MPCNVRFTISESAKRKIASLTQEFKAKSGSTVAIPAIVWLDKSLNRWLPESQPTIGMYDDEDEIDTENRMIIDGLEIVLVVTEAAEHHFQGRTLDYEDEKFLLK